MQDLTPEEKELIEMIRLFKKIKTQPFKRTEEVHERAL